MWIWALAFLGTVEMPPAKVAVVDMGINAHKAQLQGFVETSGSWDYSRNLPSQGVDYAEQYDKTIHGTLIAEIITDRVSSEIKLMDIVYTDREGKNLEINKYERPQSGRERFLRTQIMQKFSDHLAEAFDRAVQAGAVVINFSSGHPAIYSEKLEAWVRTQAKLGRFVVLSAGNESEELKKVEQYPFKFTSDNLLRVGSIDTHGRRSKFSNYGKGVDIYAVGENLTDHGTSFAAPEISRALGLIKYYNPTWSTAQVRTELFKYTLKKPFGLVFDKARFDSLYTPARVITARP